MRAASRQEPAEEGAEVRSPAGVATSGGLPSPLLGEGAGEGEEIGSVGVTTAEQAPSPPPDPQGEAEIPAAAGAADLEEENEEYADDPPDFFLTEVDAETLYNRSVHLLQLAHININELDQVSGLAGGLIAAVEARRNMTLAEAELQQAFVTLRHEFDRENRRRAVLIDRLTDLNEQHQRDLQLAQTQNRQQRDRAEAMRQLRDQLEVLLHQARLRNQQQEMEMVEAAPGIQQLAHDRDFAAADANHFEAEAERLRLQNTQLEQEVALITADNARHVREAGELHAELHRWHRMAVRLNNERTPEDRYDLPNIAHDDNAGDPGLEFEAGHEFDEPLPSLPLSPTEDVERATGRADQDVAQPEEENQQDDEVNHQDLYVANALQLGNRHSQPPVEDHPDEVDSDADTLVGENSE